MTTERVHDIEIRSPYNPEPGGATSSRPPNRENATPQFAAMLAALLRHSAPTALSADWRETADDSLWREWPLTDALAPLMAQLAAGAFTPSPFAPNTSLLTGLMSTLPALLAARGRRIPWPSEGGQDPTAWLQVPQSPQVGLSLPTTALTTPSSGVGPLPLEAFPRPAADNGRGMHWIPTLYQSPEIVDRFVRELQAMKMKWAVILNDGTDTGRNDYLVQRLVQAGIMPVMRIYTPGLQPLDPEALEKLVRHYRAQGVYYYQIYNEPNLRFENGGRDPDVKRYLDLWIPAAEAVARAGGFPGFGALSPSGDVDDLVFLRAALRELKRRGRLDVLDRAWLSVHNYLGPYPVEDTGDGRGFFRYRRYAEILLQELGRVLPMIGTESGAYADHGLTPEEQVQRVRQAYAYLAQREPYFLAYSYWIIANEAGGGRDPAFSHQALFRPDGVSPVVNALKEL